VKSVADIEMRVIPIRRRARSRPRVAVVWIHAVFWPRFSSELCSAT
jgi:hypothetical protein